MSELIIKIFKSLSYLIRFEIIKFLLEKKEWSCQELSKKFALSQPALSHHLGKLIEAKIISVRKSGTENYYSINSPYLNKMGIDINKIIKKGKKI